MCSREESHFRSAEFLEVCLIYPVALVILARDVLLGIQCGDARKKVVDYDCKCLATMDVTMSLGSAYLHLLVCSTLKDQPRRTQPLHPCFKMPSNSWGEQGDSPNYDTCGDQPDDPVVVISIMNLHIHLKGIRGN